MDLETHDVTGSSETRARPRTFLRSALRWAVIGVTVVAVLLAALVLPIPVVYAYLPGPVRDVGSLVEIDGASTYSSEGRLYLTTVSVDTHVTFVEWIVDIVDPSKSVVMKEDVTGGAPLEDVQRQQRIEMKASKQHAEEVALTALGLGHPEGDGARVVQTIEGAPAFGVLERGDVIASLDGTRVETSCDVGRIVSANEIGERVTVAVRRNGRVRTFNLETTEDPRAPGSAFLGIGMSDVNYRFDPGMDVRFKTGQIAGPSAGLFFSLALYDKLTPDDLTRGHKVAGTGTIACDGDVGPIGGIEQKVAGAEREGAEIFLSPRENAAAAREVANDIEIVAVSTFGQAIEYLEALQ